MGSSPTPEEIAAETREALRTVQETPDERFIRRVRLGWINARGEAEPEPNYQNWIENADQPSKKKKSRLCVLVIRPGASVRSPGDPSRQPLHLPAPLVKLDVTLSSGWIISPALGLTLCYHVITSNYEEEYGRMDRKRVQDHDVQRRSSASARPRAQRRELHRQIRP